MRRPLACDNPLRHPPAEAFAGGIARLRQRFAQYAATCPAPLPAAGLVVTPEIRYQAELYLPLAELRPILYRYYRASLTHPPIFVSTPLHSALSWADCFADLPPWLQQSPSPALLLERLLADAALHEQFIYASFLPERYNGAGFGRYPAQLAWLRQWAEQARMKAGEPLHCLDAACGSGEGSWELAGLLAAGGYLSDQVLIDGWTLDPLEVYAATNRCLPHLPQRQHAYRQLCAPLLAAGWEGRLRFQAVDLLTADLPPGQYGLILCNGLLGGPLLHRQTELQQVIVQLVERLRPHGWLLVANRFHGGWHRRVPDHLLAGLFRQAGCVVQALDDGIAVQRSC